MSISVGLRGAHRAEGEVAKGYVVYSSAYANDADLLQRPHLFGTEEYLSFATAPESEAVVYDVSLGEGVDGVRAVGNSIEFLDRSGTPRLRMAPPFVIGSGETKAWATVAVSGCTVDRNALPPWGRSIVRPGSSHCAVRVGWAGSGIQYPAVLDPSWSLASSMSVARAFHGSARVNISGRDRALVYGGATFVSSTTSAEVYDELTGTWAQTGSMVAGVKLAASTQQSDGRVLVFGGYSMSPAGALYDGVQSFNPATGSWSLDGSLGQGRMSHTATALPSGKILVAGGIASAGSPLTLHQGASLYDPSTHQVSAAGNALARAYQTATLLNNGKVLVVGGIGTDNVAQASVELYDPTANSWNSAAPLPIGGRYFHTATALPNGQVLVAGGSGPPGTVAETLSTALFNPSGSVWSVGPSTATSHFMATSILLTQGQAAGKVLLAGGDFALATVETFDPVSSSWKTIAPLGQGRDSHQLINLASGLLVTGGTDGDGSVLSGAELYNADAATAAGANSLVAPPLDRSVVTTTAMQTQFLYTGTNPVQTGVPANTIDPTRGAGLVGLVKRRDDGAPLGGVTITVVGHPEYGQTLTQNDGTYRLAINGTAARETLNIALNGYLPARRDVRVAPLQFATVPDVALVTASTDTSTPISMSTGGQPAPGTRMYRGPTVTDANGSRQLSVYFPPLVTAGTLRADQTTQTLPTVTLHATEYTVGPNGAAAMPADLPPTSAYTYAVELGIEEASNAQFSSAVPVYVDNFLGFPAGTTVPSGYYDPASAQWVPSANGRTIKILSITGGVANLDVDGSNTAANATALAALGITTAERTQLASSYSAGKSLWRVPITHFSLYDFNLGFVPPAGAMPGAPGDNISDPDPPGELCEVAGGSVIECETQTLKETVPIAGTPYSLNYRSDRTAARASAYTLKIPVTPSVIPGPLLEADVTITIAGRTFKQTFAPSPNQVLSFTWDGFDAFGRRLQGPQTASVQIDNVYNAVYAASSSFGTSAGGSPTTVPTRRPAALSGTRSYDLGTWSADGAALGGWDFDVHHVYDPIARTVRFGNGRPSPSKLVLSNVIDTVAGNGEFTGFSPDGTVAKASSVLPFNVAVGPDGLLYIGERFCVQRVTAGGLMEMVLGDCRPDSVAIDANALAFGKEGELYFAEANDSQVRKLDLKSGSVAVVAGTGSAGFSGDNGPATSAQLNGPASIAVASDGSLYIADFGNSRIRRVGTDGVIRTVAGNGVLGSGSNEIPALQSAVTPFDLALAPNGDVFILGADTSIRRLSPDGIIHGVLDQNGVQLEPSGLALAPDNSLLVWGDNAVLRIAPDGTKSVLAGNPSEGPGFAGDLGPASGALLDFTGEGGFAQGVAVAPDGSAYIVDFGNRRVRHIRTALPGVGTTDVVIPSQDGRELYVFNSAGRHLRTLDALVASAPPLYQFAYEPSTNYLKSVTDADNNVTTILRDSSGNITGIVSPFSQQTSVALGSDGLVASITNPANEAMSFTYFPGGLMQTKTSPRGFKSTYSYDSLGRLTLDNDPPEAGGFQSLARVATPNGWTVNRSTKLNRTTSYAISQASSTSERSRTNTLPDGHIVTITERPDGTRTTQLPSGAIITTLDAPDPRFGMSSPVTSTTVETPGGLTRTETVSRTATLSDPANPLSLTAASETRTINGRIYQTTFDPATLTLTTTSPESRKTFSTLNNRARVASTRVDTLLARELTYDSRGRLSLDKMGTRTTELGYNASSGFLTSVKNALSETTTLTLDAVGRPTRITVPDTNFTLLGYDKDSNLTSITPPGQPEHLQTFNAVNLFASYQPPTATGTGTKNTTYAHDFDRNLGDVTRPDGLVLTHGYDAAGRLETMTLPTGTIRRTYDATTGQLATLAGPAGETITFGYDAFLLKSTTWGGTVAGTVNRTYDNDFRLSSTQVNTGTSVSFGYDGDSLLTSAGSVTLTPDPKTGLLKNTTLGAVTDAFTYSSDFGELASHTAKFNTTTLYAENITLRDALGRIKTKTETVQGTTHSYDYTYDTRGRLTDVKTDGALTAHYTYDANGNRLSKTSGATTTSGTYDAQDRLTTYGTATYAYTANGEPKTKTVGSQTTSYTYDVLGNLTNVTLPGGPNIDYIPDGLNHRVGKKLNTSLTKGFLWADQLRILAELGPTNNIVSTFVYGTKVNVPEYMTKAGVNYRIVTDHLGSVRLVVKVTDGTVAQRIDYDEFGVVTADTSPGFQPFGFAGGLYDPDTKLVRFGARDYDASTGRWTAKDPIRFAGGGSNIYVYGSNDPTNRSDPSGLLEGLVVEEVAVAVAESGPVGWAIAFAGAAVGFAIYEGYGLYKDLNPDVTGPDNACKPEAARRWQCTASCNVDNLGIRVSGSGSGSSQEDACRAAKKDANNQVPAGSYKRHCQCTCWQ